MDNSSTEATMQDVVVFVVPKASVKTVKSALESRHLLDRKRKIKPLEQDRARVEPRTTSQQDPIRFPRLTLDLASGQYVAEDSIQNVEEKMCIPSTITWTSNAHAENEVGTEQTEDELKWHLLRDLDLMNLADGISIRLEPQNVTSNSTNIINPVRRALHGALSELPASILSSLNLSADLLVSAFPDSYSVYKPMLLLPNTAFASQPWTAFLAAYPSHSDCLQPVWAHVAAAAGTTHVAINSPIPLQTSEDTTDENVLRAPVNLTPLHGDFGPRPTSKTVLSPTQKDFDEALWVTTIQNGIEQTWAPLYTMFSRGNVKEKARVLNLPSVRMEFDTPSSALDLYAGIGYFAFSYRMGGAGSKNGIRHVICFELNPWSIEGLRRGAQLNGWTTCIWKEKDLPTEDDDWKIWTSILKQARADFWIFEMDNRHATRILECIEKSKQWDLPPIRHVNLGLLPRSDLSWRTAISSLDSARGGWIHVHENVGERDIEARSTEVEQDFQDLLNKRSAERQEPHRRVRVEHSEKVKTYAPGVLHVVFDLIIEGQLRADPDAGTWKSAILSVESYTQVH